MLRLLKFSFPFKYILLIPFTLTYLHICTFIHAQIRPTPAQERLKCKEQRLALEKKSIVNAVKFHSIGPSIMSGRVVDVDVNPKDPTEFYVAYATDGLW